MQTVRIALAGMPLALLLVAAAVHAQTPPPVGPPPGEPSEADRACEVDADCVATCEFSAHSCCPTYCVPCTLALNREAYQRRQALCRASAEVCPTVGACADELVPAERIEPRCQAGRCGVERVPLEGIGAAAAPERGTGPEAPPPAPRPTGELALVQQLLAAHDLCQDPELAERCETYWIDLDADGADELLLIDDWRQTAKVLRQGGDTWGEVLTAELGHVYSWEALEHRSLGFSDVQFETDDMGCLVTEIYAWDGARYALSDVDERGEDCD